MTGFAMRFHKAEVDVALSVNAVFRGTNETTEIFISGKYQDWLMFLY